MPRLVVKWDAGTGVVSDINLIGLSAGEAADALPAIRSFLNDLAVAEGS